MTEPIITSGVIITLLGVLGLWAKVLMNYMSKRKKDNPVNLDMFYQEFRDFKKEQQRWNSRIQKEIDELEKMRHPGK